LRPLTLTTQHRERGAKEGRGGRRRRRQAATATLKPSTTLVSAQTERERARKRERGVGQRKEEREAGRSDDGGADATPATTWFVQVSRDAPPLWRTKTRKKERSRDHRGHGGETPVKASQKGGRRQAVHRRQARRNGEEASRAEHEKSRLGSSPNHRDHHLDHHRCGLS